MFDQLTQQVRVAEQGRDSAEVERLQLSYALNEERAEREHFESEARYWKDQAETLQIEAARFSTRSNALAELRRWPTTLIEVVDLAGQTFGDTLVFTERARNAADEAIYFDDVAAAWRVLRAMATELAPLFFTGTRGAREIEGEFRSRTGLELAMTETGSTKQRKHLAALRVDKHDGMDIDITAHVKYGTEKPRLLRVHFAVDRERTRLLIGHVGDHLETFSTRRRK